MPEESVYWAFPPGSSPPYLPEPRGELTRVWSQALALVGGHVVGLEVGVDGVILEGAHHLLDGVGDEDEGDEAGEALLGEARHVLDDVAGVRGHQDEALQAGVHPDPQTQLHVVYTVVPVGRRDKDRSRCVKWRHRRGQTLSEVWPLMSKMRTKSFITQQIH